MSSEKSSFRKAIFNVIDDHRSKKLMNKLFHGLLFFLILFSSTILFIETITPVFKKHYQLFVFIEIFTISFFTIEYLLRIYTSVEISSYKHPIFGRLKYAFTPLMIIDLLSIIPMYFFLTSMDLGSFYLFSIFRILRLFKAIRYVKAFQIIGDVFYLKREQLLISFSMIVFMFIFFSFIIFIAEKNAQPEVFKDVTSAMWLTISSITTIGYGDIYPITAIGKTICGLIGISGWLLFAIPTSILTSGFLKITINNKQKHTCPHCGKQHE
jgi:voltage-gated potassium channel